MPLCFCTKFSRFAVTLSLVEFSIELLSRWTDRQTDARTIIECSVSCDENSFILHQIVWRPVGYVTTTVFHTRRDPSIHFKTIQFSGLIRLHREKAREKCFVTFKDLAKRGGIRTTHSLIPLPGLSRVLNSFLPAQPYASAGNNDRNVSVCPSVRHAPVLCQNEES